MTARDQGPVSLKPPRGKELSISLRLLIWRAEIFPGAVTLQSRVGRRHGIISGVKTKNFPGLGIRALRLESQGADFFVDGAKASRLRQRRLRAFFESLPIPTDASGAYRPNPQANNEVCRRPLSLKGYPFCEKFLD